MGTSVTADAPKLPPVTGEPPHAHGDTPRMNDSRQKRMSDCPSHGHRRRGEAVPVIETLSTLVGGKGGDAGLFSAALAGPFEEILNWHAADSAASPARVATPSGSLNGSTAMSNGGS